MRAVLRTLAGLFFLVAAFAAIADVTYSMGGKGVVMTSLLDHWGRMAPQSLAGFQGGLRRIPLVWPYLVRPLLSVPAWGFFALIGVLCAWGGRRRSSVNIFAN
jgi:hypothetical protein